jgi:hypothetical protein
LALLSQLGGSLLATADKPARPDHEKREEKHSSTREERRGKPAAMTSSGNHRQVFRIKN